MTKPSHPASGTPAPGTAPQGLLQRRPWVARLVLAVLGPALLLGVLEGGLRLAGFGYPVSLFLPVEEAGTYGMNRSFGWRFFPREIARTPVPQAFDIAKSPRTCRIFTLGASAALGVPNSAFGFTRQLEVMLTERYPGVRFEVVNTALTAINSHVVRPIASEIAAYEPDVYLVYLGNNEVIGPFGIGGSADGRVAPLAAVRAGIALKSTRTGQFLGGLGRGEVDASQWRGMQMYSRHLARPGDAALAQVHENFRSNLVDICRAGTGAGAQVVLSTVAVNLRDSPPFAAGADSTLPAAVQRRRDRLLGEAAALLGAGQAPPGLADSLAVAARLDPGHAEVPFLRGHLALATGDNAGARAYFETARELDALRFRADAAINGIIRQTAGELADRGVVLADVERTISKSGNGIPGREMFYEHVHLTFFGNHVVARALLPAVEVALPAWVRERADRGRPLPSVEDCARRLFYTAANEYLALAQMRTTVTPYPFTAQLWHDARFAALDADLARLREQATPEVQRRTLETYAEAWRRNPGDLLLGVNFARLLSLSGNEQAARQVMGKVMATQPPAAQGDRLNMDQLAGGG